MLDTVTTPEQKYQQLFEAMYQLCDDNNWGDPFSYARSREIHLAGILGHQVSDTLSGADAYDSDNNPVEYKSTIGISKIWVKSVYAWNDGYYFKFRS